MRTYLLICFLIRISFPSYSQAFWEQVNSPANVNPLYIASSDDNIFYLGTNNGVYISFDQCNSWENIGMSEELVSCLLITKTGKVFSNDGSGGIHRYLDNGIWELVFWSFFGIIDLAEDINNNIYAGKWGGIFKSSNEGDDWIQTLTISPNVAVYSIREDLDGILYAGVTDFMGGEGVYCSTDQGETWTNFGLTNAYVTSLAVNSNNELFAGAQGHQYLYEEGSGVYKYDKDLQGWIHLKDSLIVVSMVINSLNDIYVGLSNDWGTYGGVYASYDNGMTWDLLEEGLGKDYMEHLMLNSQEYLYTISGWDTNTIHKSVNSTVGLSPIVNPITTLVYNYPNPFHEETMIYWALPNEITGDLSFSVYDLSGSQVVRKQFKTFRKSWGQLHFSASGFSSGVYLFEIISGKYRIGNKMVIK